MTVSKLSLYEAHAALDRARAQVTPAIARVDVSIVRCAEIEGLIERHARIILLARDLLTVARLDADDAERELSLAVDDHIAAIRNLQRAVETQIEAQQQPAAREREAAE